MSTTQQPLLSPQLSLCLPHPSIAELRHGNFLDPSPFLFRYRDVRASLRVSMFFYKSVILCLLNFVFFFFLPPLSFISFLKLCFRSLATGDVTDVVIQVEDSRFCLHKVKGI